MYSRNKIKYFIEVPFLYSMEIMDSLKEFHGIDVKVEYSESLNAYILTGQANDWDIIEAFIEDNNGRIIKQVVYHGVTA